MYLRITRICSKDDVFEKRVDELRGYLVGRRHSDRFVEMNRARNTPREETLRDKPRIPFVVTYNPGMPNINN